MLAAFAGGCATVAPGALTHEEKTLTVPGFADFLAVDGDTVWATNRGKVEQWSRAGKLAEVPMTAPCGAMAVAAGSLWVADCKEQTVHRIDTRSGQTSAVISTGIANPAGELNIVAGAGSIWAPNGASGTIARVDPAQNKVVATVTVNPGAYYLAFGFGSLWAVSGQTRTVQRIDPSTDAVVETIALGRQPGFLVAGEGGVWIQEQGDGTVARVDPKSGGVTGRTKVSDTLVYGDIDAGGGAIWLRTTTGQTYVIIDPLTMKVIARVGRERGSGALRYTKKGLWVTAHDAHTLSWFNASSHDAHLSQPN